MSRQRASDKRSNAFRYDGSRRRASPHEALAGQYVGWHDTSGNVPYYIDDNLLDRTIIASEDLYSITEEMASFYAEKCIMSLDGLLRPVSMDGDGQLPRYIKYDQEFVESAVSFITIETGVLEPYREREFTEIGSAEADIPLGHQDELNPLTNPQGFTRDYVAQHKSNTHTYGHDFEMLARVGDGPADTPSDGLIMPPILTEQSEPDYAEDYRFFALRAPIVIQGWGYDTDGFPVPNEADNIQDILEGDFAVDNRTNKFMDKHLRRSRSWPVAPLDLRLDRDRGVWTVGGHTEWYGKVLDKYVPPNKPVKILIEHPDPENLPWTVNEGNTLSINNDTNQGLFRDTRCVIKRHGETFKIISTASDFRIWEGIAQEDIAPGESGKVKIYRPQANEEEIDYDDFEVYAFNFWKHGDNDIEEDDRVLLYVDRGEWKILQTGSGGGGSDIEVVALDCSRPEESGFYFGFIQVWNPICTGCDGDIPTGSGNCEPGTGYGQGDSGKFSQGVQCRIVDLTEWFPPPEDE